MKEKRFYVSLRRAIMMLIDIDVVFHPREWGVLRPSVEFKTAALSRTAGYEDLYLIGLRQQDYNVLLNDFSYLQFYCEGDRSDIGLRYAFYPSPYELPTFEEFVEEFGEWTVEGFELYVQDVAEKQGVFRRPCVRYELSRRDYRFLRHPTSHFHLGLHEENRWPVNKEITPEAFAFLVAKLFYPEKWNTAAGECDRSEGLVGLERRLADARANCSKLPRKLFSRHERNQFYFS